MLNIRQIYKNKINSNAEIEPIKQFPNPNANKPGSGQITHEILHPTPSPLPHKLTAPKSNKIKR